MKKFVTPRRIKLSIMPLIMVSLLSFVNACSDLGEQDSADPLAKSPISTLYYGGNILTMVGEQPNYVDAVVTQNGRIVFVGDKAGATNKYHQAIQFDLQGKTMMPGFIDSHSHVTQLALALSIANLAAPPYGLAGDFDGVQHALKEYIEQNDIPDGGWVMGIGYDTSILPDHPTKTLLDEVSTDYPILIIHSSGHIGVANSKALAIAKITKDSKNPEGGVIQRMANGEPNGVLEESAMWPVMLNAPQPDLEQKLIYLEKSLSSYASFGITTVQDGRTTPDDLVLLEAAAKQNKLYLDVIAYPAIEYISDKWQPDFDGLTNYQHRLKIGGVKLSLDGSMPGKTAFLSQPYFKVPKEQNKSYRGYPAWSDDKVNAYVKQAWDNKWQILVHNNADAAGDQFINAIKKIGNTASYDWRPVMVHSQAAREDQLDDMKILGIIPSFEMTHPFLFGDYYVDSVFGKERGERNNPAGSAQRRNLPYTFHTDAPVVVPDVLMAAWAGVNRVTRSGKVIGPQQRVSAYQAMQALTINAAYQNFEEQSKGTIEEGKLADFVILSKNPIKVPTMEIKDIKIITTIKEGQTIWSSASSS